MQGAPNWPPWVYLYSLYTILCIAIVILWMLSQILTLPVQNTPNISHLSLSLFSPSYSLCVPSCLFDTLSLTPYTPGHQPPCCSQSTPSSLPPQDLCTHCSPCLESTSQIPQYLQGLPPPLPSHLCSNVISSEMPYPPGCLKWQHIFISHLTFFPFFHGTYHYRTLLYILCFLKKIVFWVGIFVLFPHYISKTKNVSDI